MNDLKKEENDAFFKHLKVIMVGFMISIFMFSLDSSITSTAMPKIIASLGGLEYYIWPFTIYLAALTISMMLSGKLSDFYSNKKIIMGALATFIISSVLCGLSGNMIELIIFRGLQGLGGGMLIVVPLKMSGEIIPIRQRGKYMGLISSISVISAVIGPTLGGFITDTLGWQWIFFINFPLGIVAILLLWTYLPDIGTIIKEKIIDYAGIITFTVGLSSFLIALTFIQQNTNISTSVVVSLFALAAIMLLAFLYAEKHAKEPVLPLYLFKNSTFNISAIAMAIIGAILLNSSTYVPLFLQGVQGMSASNAGALVSPMLISSAIMAIVGGGIFSKTGRYKIIVISSFGFFILGMGLLSTMTFSTTILEVVIYSMLVGIGLGLSIPIFTIVSQDAVVKRDMGVATSSIQFFRNFGSVVGLAILGAIVDLTLNLNLQTTTTSIQPALLNTAMHNVFITGLIIGITGFMVCIFLKERLMSDEMKEEKTNYKKTQG